MAYISYKCPNCGATINNVSGNKVRCNHCGTEYFRDNNNELTVIHCDLPLVRKAASVTLHEEELISSTREQIIEFSLENIAHKIAEDLISDMEINTYRDIEHRYVTIEGMIRVAKPNKDISDINELFF